MGKNIVLCLDGTWNGPDSKDDHGNATPTNVQKIFESLMGSAPLGGTDQEKELEWSAAGIPASQSAKYIFGVGDMSNNKFVQACQGAVGLGLVGRIVRGYTYLSRVYEDGDRIFIIGFSRGAYTARALAGLVVKKGLLDWKSMKLVARSEESYSAGLSAWQEYKNAIHQPGNILSGVAAVVSNLQAAVQLGLHPSPPLQYIGDVGIAAVGVWDTVGALGIPDIQEKDGSAVRVDVFRFCDTKLNDKVKNGFHAVAIDEQRVDFTPTLWDEREGVVQVLFPGAHADVGGGYPVKDESGLSNGALAWMARQLASVGVVFSRMPEGKPVATALQHQPWLGGKMVFLEGVRHFPPGMRLSQSVLQRIAAPSVPVDSGPVPDGPYRPKNIVNSYVMLDWSGAAPHVIVEP
jgi:uncharacterized protein (DUF2235 family)